MHAAQHKLESSLSLPSTQKLWKTADANLAAGADTVLTAAEDEHAEAEDQHHRQHRVDDTGRPEAPDCDHQRQQLVIDPAVHVEGLPELVECTTL